MWEPITIRKNIVVLIIRNISPTHDYRRADKLAREILPGARLDSKGSFPRSSGWVSHRTYTTN